MKRIEEPEYTDKYVDDNYEYRQVLLPRRIANKLDIEKLLTEEQCIELGIRQSRGWAHYGFHKYEPYILLFKRPLGTDPKTGRVNKELLEQYRKMAEFKKIQYLAQYCQ